MVDLPTQFMTLLLSLYPQVTDTVIVLPTQFMTLLLSLYPKGQIQ